MLVRVLNSSGLPAKCLQHLISSPYLPLEAYTYSCYKQEAFLFCKHFCIQFNLVIQNMGGRKPDSWYYEILQILFWSHNCTVLSKGRSPSYLATTGY